MPSLIVIAGPNGSGKSTLYKRLAKRMPSFGEIPFINPDEVAKELFGEYLYEDTTQARARMLAAGKEALKRRKSLLESKQSFGFETTLSGNSEIRMIKQAKRLGYSVILVFVGLDDPAMNVMRVKLRVQNGGHFVDPEDVVRRWDRSMNNLKEVYDSARRIYLVDNSEDGHRKVASIVRYRTHDEVDVDQKSNRKWHLPVLERFRALSNRSVKPPLERGGYKLHSQSEY